MDEKDRPLVYDVIGAIVRSVMQDRIADRQWDVAPTLLMVVEVAADEDGKPLVFSVSGDLPIPPSPAPLPHVLRAMARAADAEPTAPPEAWHRAVAVLLVAEAYSLHVPPESTEAERRDAFAWCAKHAIADHPWGVETKMVTAVDCYGTIYLTEYHRQQEGESPVHDTYEGGRDLGGEMPGALQEILAAIGRAIDARSN